MSHVAVAIIGAGPYGLSLAAHLGARNIEHRIFGEPMQFWANVAEAASERYLKTFCFATNISTPRSGFSFADYNRPRGLETYEPCPIGNFAAYGQWFQQNNVPWVEALDVQQVEAQCGGGFGVTLADGERCSADHVVVATGLAHFASVPPVVASLPPGLATHTSKITSFSAFKGRSVAVIGAGQSALEAAALLQEAGAQPQLLVREREILWHNRTHQERSLWQRVRYPVSGLGVGPKAWALINFPGAMHRLPTAWRTRFLKSHLPAEGAWWLRARVEGKLRIHLGSTIASASESGGRVSLQLSSGERIMVDHVIAGSGYVIDVERLTFLNANLRAGVERIQRAPKLNAQFETSVAGLHFVGPATASSFGPLFRFVVGAEYTAQTVSAHLASQVTTPQASKVLSAA